MTKRIFECIVCLVMLVCFGGCNAQEVERSKTVETGQAVTATKKYIPYFSEDCSSLEFYKEFAEFPKNVEEIGVADAELQAQVDKLLEELVNFLNEEYSANWKYSNICMKIADMEKVSSEVNNSLQYRAMYNDGAIWVQESFVAGDLQSNHQAYYVIAHEMLHYLYRYNGGEMFCLKKEVNDKVYVCGAALEEAIVDELARRFAISKGFDSSEISSAYKYVRNAIDILSITEPDVFQYFFRDDIEGFREEFNLKVEECIKVDGDQFEKFCHLMNSIVLNPNEKNKSYMFSLLIVITPKEYYEEVNKKQKNVYKVEEDFSALMK